MSFFDKFKKKKDDKKSKPVSDDIQKPEESSEETPEKASAADGYRAEDFGLDTDFYMSKDTAAYELWNIYQTGSETNETFKPFEYIEPIIIEAKKNSTPENPDHTEQELGIFVRQIQNQCEKTITKMKNEQKAAEKEPEKNITVSPANAEPMLYMTKNKLRLWIVVIPPINNGDDITDETLRFRMDSMSIKYGIDNDAIEKIVSEKTYMKIIQIAVGKKVVHGKSGSVKNMFSKVRNHVNIKEDQNGNVNYKELNMIQSIHKGDVICEITLPTEGSDGMSVTGETIAAREGKYPIVPAGKNTEYNEDKTLLVAKIDGEVVFEDNKFNVRNLLTIDSNVDNSVGNIHFAGDVLIKGDVREGYSVKAEGDVRITGTVEGSTVIVGGDLKIDRGMTGGNKGKIEVQGELKCRYLENCDVYAKEGIEADQIMYSTLSTDKNIVLKGKKGSVTGGRLIAGGTIEAHAIGTPANNTLKTEIVLGVVPRLIEKEKSLKNQIEEIQDKMLKMTQDITYINKNIKQVNEDRKDLLKNLLFQYQLDQKQCKKMEAELESVMEKIRENTESCSLKCEMVYPIMNLNVCGDMYTIDREIRECRITRKNDKTYVTGSDLESMIVF